MDKNLVIGNVCFILDKEHKKVLLLKRAKEPMKGLFTGVGGKAEFNEYIQESCLREVKEETGMDVTEVKLRGVIKTILENKNSSWLLFIYQALALSDEFIPCDEGELQWVDLEMLPSLPLIGFIKEIIPYVLQESGFIEGLIYHDLNGNVLTKKLM